MGGLTEGDPVGRTWILYIVWLAVSIGLASIPSTGAAIALIPMFLLAGTTVFIGVFKKRARKSFVCSGLGLLSITAWVRGWALWGVSAHGVGSNIVASLSWVNIAIGVMFLLFAVFNRGVE